MRTVYLAGPIAGCTEGEANTWRKEAQDFLIRFRIMGVSPLRDEAAVDGGYATAEDFAAKNTIAFGRAIAAKNWTDIRMCDMVLAVCPKVEGRPSYGTVWEIGAAYALQKPIVLVSNNPAIVNHPDIDISVGWKYENLDEGLAKIVQILGPYA